MSRPAHSADALQKSELLFRDLSENSPNMIFIFQKGRVVYANNECSRIMGYSREELLSDDFNFRVLIAPESRTKIEDSFSRHLQGENVRPFEYTLITRENNKIDAILTSKLMQYNGESAILGIVTDISGMKKAQEELIDLNRKLSQLISTKDRLFTIIAHDLREPFNAILGYSDFLLEGKHVPGGEKTEDLLKQIRISAREAYNLLENLLAWARSQSGQIDLKPENLSLASLVTDVLSNLSSSAEIKNINLINNLFSDYIVSVNSDLFAIILRNLISNALKFTLPGGKVCIEAKKSDNMVEISVTDSGIGIDENLRLKIFSAENGITSDGTSGEKGSGLGLILCREFVEKQGGKIWFESWPGKGSVFHFTMPAAK